MGFYRTAVFILREWDSHFHLIEHTSTTYGKKYSDGYITNNQILIITKWNEVPRSTEEYAR